MSRFAAPSPLLLAALLVWIAVAGMGFVALAFYETTPGDPGTAPAERPRESGLPAPEEHPALVAALEEQSTTPEDMARSVASVSAVSTEAAHGVSQIAAAGDGLGRLTEELRALVRRFRTGATPPAGGVYGDGSDTEVPPALPARVHVASPSRPAHS